ncbi:MAG: hypothetical protein Ct9H300mP27_08230 [Chloroflexota bacterium]|nr:MAG: hypothetical protein Ct9H300mP27_08230 [Chloroflexota bacterium]
MSYVRDNNFQSIVPTIETEDAWVKHVNEDGAKILRTQQILGSWEPIYLGRHGPYSLLQNCSRMRPKGRGCCNG